MGRKNRRNRNEYRKGLNFNPTKYVAPTIRRVYVGRTPKRGDIWFADLGRHPETSVQGGCRPVLIVSNDIGNYHAETINVLPITKHMKKPDLPCHTMIAPTDLFDMNQYFELSMILAEQITTIDKSQLRNYVGRVEDRGVLERISTSVSGQLGLIPDSRMIQDKEESGQVQTDRTEDENG